ncbi:MAG: PGF-pre-PGF domain-containing protein, partial [Candidatus Nanohaloarchaea archaeon]
YVTANISNDPVNMPELQLEVPELNDVDGNGTLNDTADTGFFVNGSSDTGGVTGTKHTIYTANITEVETRSSVDDANPENAEEVVIRFSEYVNVSGVAFNDDINFTNPEVTTPNPNTPLTNVTEMVVGIDSLGGNKVTGIEYMGTGIKTYERGFELSHDNSSVDIIDGVNNAPNADAGGDRSVDEGGSLTLDCDSSTDPEGDNLDCRWKITGDPTNGATIEGESQGTWVSGSSVDFEAPTVDGDATVEVTLQVNDTGGLTDVSVFDVLVTNTQTTQTTQTSGGGGGSGQGSGSGSKQDDQKAQEPTKISRSVIIGRGKSEKLDIGAETVGSMRIEAASSSEVIGSLEYEEKSSRPSSVESDPEGKAYKYIRIEKNNFDNRQVESVEFRFKVSKGWINSNNIAPKTVKLQRYNSGWLQLDTRVRSEDAGNYYYTATSPGFSVFSVTGTSYSDLFKVQEIKVDSKSIQKGGNVTISVTVHNGAQSRASYNLEVKAGGKTLSRDIEVDGGANRTVTFTRSFSEAGTKTVSAGGKSVEVQVKSKGLPWMIIGAAVLGLLGLGATYLFWPEIKGELGWVEAELGGFTDKLSGLEEVPKMVGKLGAIPRVIGEIGSSKGGKRSYSFEGFGEDEDFDYSFDE